jgi:hypothetical protein
MRLPNMAVFHTVGAAVMVMIARLSAALSVHGRARAARGPRTSVLPLLASTRCFVRAEGAFPGTHLRSRSRAAEPAVRRRALPARAPPASPRPRPRRPRFRRAPATSPARARYRAPALAASSVCGSPVTRPRRPRPAASDQAAAPFRRARLTGKVRAIAHSTARSCRGAESAPAAELRRDCRSPARGSGDGPKSHPEPPPAGPGLKEQGSARRE